LLAFAVGSACSWGDGRVARASTASPAQALHYIYYYAYRPRQGRRLALSLDAAVTVLKNDKSIGWERRRRIGIAKLVGATTVAKNSDGSVQLRPDDMRKAVQELAGTDFPAILTQVARLQPNPSRQDQERAAFAALAQGPDTNLKPPTSCVVQDPECEKPTVDPKTGTVTMNFSFNVQLPFERVIRATFPRFWHECNSTFFNGAFAAEKAPDGTYHVDATGTAERDPQQPDPLTPGLFPVGQERHWVLFEDFTTVEVSFKNLLDITEKFQDPKTYSLVYTLNRSINRTLLEKPPEAGGIAADSGFIKVADQGSNRTLFAGQKSIQFADSSLNDLALLFIQDLCDESMGLGAGFGVCCVPGAH